MSSHRLPPRVGRPAPETPSRRPAARKARGSRAALRPALVAAAVAALVAAGVGVASVARQAYRQAQVAAANDAFAGPGGTVVTRPEDVPGLAGGPSADGWARVEDPMLTVELPATPVYAVGPFRLGGQDQRFERWAAQTGRDRLVASAGWVHEHAYREPAETLAEVRGVVLGQGGRIASERPVTLGEAEGFEVSLDRGDLKTVLRAYVLPKRAVYLVEVTGANAAPGSAGVERVFSSLELPTAEEVDALRAAEQAEIDAMVAAAEERAGMGRPPGGAVGAIATPPGAGPAGEAAAADLGAYAGPGSVPPTGRSVTASTPLFEGMIVQADWHGTWYPATVLGVSGDLVTV